MTIPRAVSAYYGKQSGVHLETLLEMRTRILKVVPDAEEVIKYGMPTFVVDGVEVCGLLANKAHIGYYPYSGSLLDRFPEITNGMKTTKGALHIPLGKPLSLTAIRTLVRAKLSDCPVVARTTPAPQGDDSVWKALGIAAPARRALLNAKITKLEQLVKKSESDIAQLHGMGPSAMTVLRAALKQKKLSFKK
ncbi:MAG: hypothetical protein RL410_218 [Actinomycetota bacterium]|jgi:uncharacterized protein YdhG (YjbR/CyaY superfamily)